MFRHFDSIDYTTLPLMPVDELRHETLQAIQQGWRLLALFGLPVAEDNVQGGVGLCVLLADNATQSLHCMRSVPVTAYPALTCHCPQAHRFEQELYEQWRILPEEHPWLKPLRFMPSWLSENAERPGPGETAYFRIAGREVHEVGVGPVHAGIIEPGHFRFQCYGENVMHLEISLGFQHRGLERLVMQGVPASTLPLLECAAGDASIAHATAACLVLERLTIARVPVSAHLLRRIALELERLANHTGDLGAIAGDVGYLPTSAWNGRIRGDFLNMTALLCGNRFGRGLVRPGGVSFGLDAPTRQELHKRLFAAFRDVRGSVDNMLEASSVLDRLHETGTISKHIASDLGLVGVAARACGLGLDARFDFPQSSDMPEERLFPRTTDTGDVYARTLIRSRELDDAVAQIDADLRFLARNVSTEDAVRNATPPIPPNRLAVGLVESWRGEVCHVGVTGANSTWRAYKIYDPSFHNWMGLAMALRNEQISDFPLCNKSFNLSYCGHDL